MESEEINTEITFNLVENLDKMIFLYICIIGNVNLVQPLLRKKLIHLQDLRVKNNNFK